jgi:hypothetical protein
VIGELRACPELDLEPGERVDPRWVAHLISQQPLPGFDAPRWLDALKPLLTGPFSADNMDYVPRDAYICGVAAGPADVQRILHYSFVSPEGLALHSHGAEALFMFLSARLYLYQQVYFHRTVRRIDLQLREVFRPTIDILLGGNPLEDLERYRPLTEWSLLTEVDGWSERGDASRRELGRAWADLVARRLKWTLCFSTHLEGAEADEAALTMTREQFAERIRDCLPAHRRTLEFEVDVAAQESRAVNPASESGDILLFDPLEAAYQRGRVLDLFRRLPSRMALFRVFVRDPGASADLAAAARRALRG